MIFSANIELDVARARERMEWFIKNKKRFELTEKKNKRSISQNSYLHLILGWYALEYGDKREHIKQEVFKKQVNREIFLREFVNRKTGEIRDEWRSTTDLDTGELTTAINRFRDYSAMEAGIYLPVPEDLIQLQQLENELSKHKQYL